MHSYVKKTLKKYEEKNPIIKSSIKGFTKTKMREKEILVIFEKIKLNH